jgi:hypothetical protein
MMGLVVVLGVYWGSGWLGLKCGLGGFSRFAFCLQQTGRNDGWVGRTYRVGYDDGVGRCFGVCEGWGGDD